MQQLTLELATPDTQRAERFFCDTPCSSFLGTHNRKGHLVPVRGVRSLTRSLACSLALSLSLVRAPALSSSGAHLYQGPVRTHARTHVRTSSTHPRTHAHVPTYGDTPLAGPLLSPLTPPVPCSSRLDPVPRPAPASHARAHDTNARIASALYVYVARACVRFASPKRVTSRVAHTR